jgi:tetratricopeptide (TPR) repeat protein
MNANSEELYLEAEADIKNNNYAEAFKKYESILYEEPDSAQAHNSMGWLYKTQFDDYAKAENHFQTASNAIPYIPTLIFIWPRC